MRRWLLVALVPAACRSYVPAPSLRGAGSDAAPATASAPRDGGAASEPAPDAAPADAAPTEASPRARAATAGPVLVFRRSLIGLLPYPGSRETWSIERYESSVVVRAVFENARASLRISGAERAPSAWEDVAEVSWSGSGGDLRAPLRLRRDGQRGEPKRELPAVLTMQCKPLELPVLAATVTLVPGDACGNGGKKPAWRPATKTRMKVERCSFEEIEASDWDGQPSFAPEPGVEWVFENSDCSAQEGAFRLLAPQGHPSAP